MASKYLRITITLLLVLGSISLINACSSQTGQRAGQGATMGAVTGAAGGMVSALIFGGDVGEAAARGAAYGGTVGAVSGAVVGSRQDQANKKKQEDVAAKMKSEFGEEAYTGLVALANCKHDVAMGHAKAAENLEKKEHSLAGLWLEVLTYADQQQEDKARALFPALIEKDPEIDSAAKVEESMRKAMQGLMKIRANHKLPQTCGQ